MSFGTPAQSFLITLDSGSSGLWVLGKDCSRDCIGRKKFDPSTSSTLLINGPRYSDEYGGAEIQGNFSIDTVGLAGYQLQGQPFAIIDQIDNLKGLLTSGCEFLAHCHFSRPALADIALQLLVFLV